MSTNPIKFNNDYAKILIEFFDSIPEYDDVNHLPNAEFYRKIEQLKEKQRIYCNTIKDDNAVTYGYETFKKQKCENNSKSENDLTPKSEDTTERSPSKRSVRIKTSPTNDYPKIERAKSQLSFSPSSPLRYSEEDNEFESNSDNLDTSKSVPNSPVKEITPLNWKSDGITVPKPFQMTVRDEENKIIDELLTDSKQSKMKKDNIIKANPVPMESRIPLFDKIMLEQEIRSQEVKEKSRERLQAQMRPFSFTKRDEIIQKINKELSKSSPNLQEFKPRRTKGFKAKPIPKHLFSNYVYQKMYDDGFYRALQKKIRSEEMLKAASLPPSMAKRERNDIKCDVCPKLFKTFNKRSENSFSPASSNQKNKEIDCIIRNNSAVSSTDSKILSSLDLLSGSRSNLAAVLRIQSARKRLEMDMCRKLEEIQLKEEARWKEKLMRKKPVWQTLAYSHEEDLELRLQMRRYEEQLRKQEHKLHMKRMYGRVNKQPTLFERQSRSYITKIEESNDQL